MKRVIKIGSDPETFIFNKENEVISAIGVIPGSKNEPFPLGDGFAAQPDNVLCEFNIPPSENAIELYSNIQKAKSLIETDLLNGLATLVALPSYEMPDAELQDPEANEFGCEGEIIAWDNSNYKAAAPESNLRTAGGHIHIGCELTDEEAVNLVKLLDLYLGVPSILLDSDTKRREIYGKAGSYRRKPYGVEYRTLSNFWIFDLGLCRFVFERVQYCVNNINKNIDHMEDRIRNIINNNDYQEAILLNRELELTLVV